MRHLMYLESCPFHLGTTPTQTCTAYKCLGAHLNNDLFWKQYIESTISRANRSLGYAFGDA